MLGTWISFDRPCDWNLTLKRQRSKTLNLIYFFSYIAQVGARCLATGVHGAVHNVDINLLQISDDSFRDEMREKARAQVELAEANCKKVLDILDGRKN